MLLYGGYINENHDPSSVTTMSGIAPTEVKPTETVPNAAAPVQPTVPALATNANGATIDIASILAKVQQLEREKADMHAKLETTTQQLSKHQVPFIPFRPNAS